ncbi:HEAT repeat domain-containing protein [Nigerium massiliense]|uniref:HEAT repeat domain-containing protein n=1 Tax=Nigerium massiliense TaxID=1522317 RepID=UPI0005914683|nr:HEAT repeat domain-containing protein [Nigerium massiliense]
MNAIPQLATPMLRLALSSGSVDRRVRAARLIAARRDVRAVGRLGACLRDPDERVRAAAAEALGAIGGTTSARVVRAAVAPRPGYADLEPALAVSALADMGMSAVEDVIGGLYDSEPRVRAVCARVVARLSLLRARPDVRRRLACEQVPAAAAALLDAVAALGVPADEPLTARFLGTGWPTAVQDAALVARAALAGVSGEPVRTVGVWEATPVG